MTRSTHVGVWMIFNACDLCIRIELFRTDKIQVGGYFNRISFSINDRSLSLCFFIKFKLILSLKLAGDLINIAWFKVGKFDQTRWTFWLLGPRLKIKARKKGMRIICAKIPINVGLDKYLGRNICSQYLLGTKMSNLNILSGTHLWFQIVRSHFCNMHSCRSSSLFLLNLLFFNRGIS